MTETNRPLLEIKNAVKRFPMPGGRTLTAVNDVSCEIRPRECLAVIGESGCGKSTLAKLVMGVEPMTSGEILLDGELISGQKRARQKRVWRDMQMIFQNAAEVISPRMKIGDFLMEPWRNFRMADRQTARETILSVLDDVRLDESCLPKYPHQLSGGELQRVCIARAFSMDPKFLVCDEITGALDVSVQDDVMRLFQDMREESGTACLFICHDLALVSGCSDRVMVMYLGSAVEILRSRELGTRALHPYTRALLGAMFFMGMRGEGRTIRIPKGETPSPVDLPEGCPFRARCPRAKAVCAEEKPPLRRVGEDHWAACHDL